MKNGSRTGEKELRRKGKGEEIGELEEEENRKERGRKIRTDDENGPSGRERGRGGNRSREWEKGKGEEK